MRTATKKPVSVKYMTWEELVEYGKNQNPESAEEHNGLAWSFELNGYAITHENDECYLITTLEGTHNMTPNDVLIIGVKGEIYPCKKDIFDMTYILDSATGKSLHNTTANGARKNVKDIKFWGDGDTFKLISKASSQAEGWMKSTKAMQIDGVGCVVQVTTQQGDNVAEAITFVPGVKLEVTKGKEGEIVKRALVKI